MVLDINLNEPYNDSIVNENIAPLAIDLNEAYNDSILNENTAPPPININEPYNDSHAIEDASILNQNSAPPSFEEHIFDLNVFPPHENEFGIEVENVIANNDLDNNIDDIFEEVAGGEDENLSDNDGEDEDISYMLSEGEDILSGMLSEGEDILSGISMVA
jgi:hypothetical protein